MQGRLTIAAGFAAVAIAPAAAHAQGGTVGMRVAVSDTNALATWSDATNVYATAVDRAGKPVGALRTFASGPAQGGIPRRAVSAWSPRMKRFILVWAAEDGIRMRHLRKDGTPIGVQRKVADRPGGAETLPLDLDVDPVDGTQLLTFNILTPTGGTQQVAIDRRGRVGGWWSVYAQNAAARKDGGFLALIGQAGDLFLQRLSSRGKAVGPRRQLTRTPELEGAAQIATHPRTGQALVVFKQGYGMGALPLDANGRPTAPAAAVPRSGDGFGTSLTPFGPDGWVIGYRQEIVGVNEIVVRRLDRRGRPVAAPQIVNAGNVDPWPSGSSLAGLGARVLVGYEHQDSASTHKVMLAAVRPSG